MATLTIPQSSRPIPFTPNPTPPTAPARTHPHQQPPAPALPFPFPASQSPPTPPSHSTPSDPQHNQQHLQHQHPPLTDQQLTELLTDLLSLEQPIPHILARHNLTAARLAHTIRTDPRLKHLTEDLATIDRFRTEAFTTSFAHPAALRTLHTTSLDPSASPETRRKAAAALSRRIPAPSTAPPTAPRARNRAHAESSSPAPTPAQPPANTALKSPAQTHAPASSSSPAPPPVPRPIHHTAQRSHRQSSNPALTAAAILAHNGAPFPITPTPYTHPPRAPRQPRAK